MWSARTVWGFRLRFESRMRIGGTPEMPRPEREQHRERGQHTRVSRALRVAGESGAAGLRDDELQLRVARDHLEVAVAREKGTAFVDGGCGNHAVHDGADRATGAAAGTLDERGMLELSQRIRDEDLETREQPVQFPSVGFRA